MLVVLMAYAARCATATLIVIAAAFVTAEFALSAAEMTACAPQIKVASIISAVILANLRMLAALVPTAKL